MSDYKRITHPFGPLFDENSRILILGSFPSVKSREQQFFYGHPQNRFWKVLSGVLRDENMQTLSSETESGSQCRENHEVTESNASCSCVSGALWVPQTIEEKKAFLHRNHVALWDVIYECDIVGSSDSSIRNVVPTDLRRILELAPIRRIYTNGGTATKLFQKYQKPILGRDSIGLPSTSPANAAWSVERLTEAWRAAIRI
ncbi:MAG: uracil-DNA glycosylase family protein [Lachnospiraceae bacterium]|nr:uracil-DNA glycosylase family protein [Lachnospiraceae bacterium]